MTIYSESSAAGCRPGVYCSQRIIIRIYIIIVINMCIVNFHTHSWVSLYKILQNYITILLLYDLDCRKLARARVERKEKQQSADND